jgi:hypothetical protein
MANSNPGNAQAGESAYAWAQADAHGAGRSGAPLRRR